MLQRPLKVCLLSEGTYPYVRGGVSTWCHDIVGDLSDIDFSLYSVIGNPAGQAEYRIPPNVSKALAVPLWGHERLVEYNAADLNCTGFHSVDALRNVFLPMLREFLNQIMRGMEYGNPATLIHIVGELYKYFREHDYDWTMRRPEVWNAAMHLFRSELWHVRFMTSLEAIELVRSLYRFLIPLAIEVPECDIMHSSVAGLCGIAAIAAKAVYGTPLILTEHGVYLRERVLALARAGYPFSDRTIKKNVFSAIARATYACADVIAPVCKYNIMWEHYYGVPTSVVRVIYNGVDETLFTDLDLSPAVPTVCAVLRIDPLKDLATLIASAVHVKARIPQVQYKIWGEGDDPVYRATCIGLIKDFGLQDTVHLMGVTKDPAHAYAESHVVALSSISEGFPFSIIEAMMCAKAIVATDVGGVREAVDEYGTVVPPKRPERLGSAIADFLEDLPRARAVGKQGREFALKHFTKRDCLSLYRNLYDEVAATSVLAAVS